MAERRKNRKIISDLDQDFINHVRRVFSDHSDKTNRLSALKLGQMLDVKDRELSGRLHAIFGGNGASKGGLRAESFQKMVVSLVCGDEEVKTKFVFDLHDRNGDGLISRPDLGAMLKAASRHNKVRLSPVQLRSMGRAMFEKADRNKDGRIDFAEFKRLLSKYPLIRNDLVKSVAAWFWRDAREVDQKRLQLTSVFRFFFLVLPRVIYGNLLLLGYLGLNAYLFWAAYKRYGAMGANMYVQIARGAGAILNLNGALILVPMLRTWLTVVRRSFLSAFFPIDHSVDIHKLIGHVFFAFGVIHSAAHIANYTGLPLPLGTSLFRTQAGLTGFIVLAAFFVLWFCALGFIRRKGWFEVFYVTHTLYLVIIIVLLVHAPNFWKWAVIPLVAYGIEVMLKRYHKHESSFVELAKALPHGVTHLGIHRPARFSYQPGDYLFLKIPSISRFEWHPFTISSNPEVEETFSVHIRTLGNWTRRLNTLVSSANKRSAKMPVVIHGPYGTPSSRIFKSKVAVLIGAGIGVTPFASILKSILYRKEHGEDLKLEKVYFYWLNRGKRSFEWFSEMLVDMEKKGMRKFMEINIYMTDARINATSGLLRIGMDLLGRQEGQDLTTGLRTITNAGRPDWAHLFADLSKKHKYRGVDVYFCGPYPLAQSVRSASRRFGFRFSKENF